jgi:hypothetical protein
MIANSGRMDADGEGVCDGTPAVRATLARLHHPGLALPGGPRFPPFGHLRLPSSAQGISTLTVICGFSQRPASRRLARHCSCGRRRMLAGVTLFRPVQVCQRRCAADARLIWPRVCWFARPSPYDCWSWTSSDCLLHTARWAPASSQQALILLRVRHLHS